jgi:S-adenosylmethionine decarboxylase
MANCTKNNGCSMADAIAFAKELFQTDDIDVHSVRHATRSLRPETPDSARLRAAFAMRVAQEVGRKRL